jgi:hypothetical protein
LRRSPPGVILCGMYVVIEADAAAIRVAYEAGGTTLAALELRRRFRRIIIDDATALEHVRRILNWDWTSMASSRTGGAAP